MVRAMNPAASLVFAGLAAAFLSNCQSTSSNSGTATLPPYDVRPASFPQTNPRPKTKAEAPQALAEKYKVTG